MRPFFSNIKPIPKKYGVDDIILLKRDHEGFVVVDESQYPNDDNTIKSFVSSRKKVILDNGVPYYHFMTDWLHMLVTELENSQDGLTVVFRKPPADPEIQLLHMDTVTNYLTEMLIELGHEVLFLEADFVYINNINLYPLHDQTDMSGVKAVAEFMSRSLDYSSAPSEKVYLSRGKTTSHNGNSGVVIDRDVWWSKENLRVLREDKKYKFSDRVDDEKALEDYFSSLGFRIVYPEDVESYRDQLQLLASTKVLVSITSASLISAMVMAPNTTIVELSFPLEGEFMVNGSLTKIRSIHSHYKNLSAIVDQTYISIVNDGVASNIISRIESNSGLKALLSKEV